MTIKEGRCPNCGSILLLDSNAEKGHCLFCDAVFQNQTAFEIAADPKSATFPNLPQPKYTGPSLEPKYMPDMSGKGQKQGQPVVKKTPKPIPPVYIPREPEKLPDIKMSREAKLKTLIISLVSLVVIAGVSVPLVMYRENARARILQKMTSIAPFAVEVEKDVEIRGLSNSTLFIAAGAAVSKDDMIKLFKNYCVQRAEVLHIDKTDFDRVYKAVTVKLVMPEGGFLISAPRDAADLESGTAIKELQ